MTVLPWTQGGLAGPSGRSFGAPAPPAMGLEITQAANGPQAGPESRA